MIEFEKAIAALNTNKDKLTPKQRKKVSNLTKEIQDLAISVAQSLSGKPITSFQNALIVIKENKNEE